MTRNTIVDDFVMPDEWSLMARAMPVLHHLISVNVEARECN
jgi:hypothetical protein